jgi:hypothetical protein
VIEDPSDRDRHREADEHGLPDAVLIRDLARIVEVLNLKAQGFFSEDSVMAGSMALRCYGSPRFTVFDADFSTTRATLMPVEEMRGKLNYADSELEIDASELTSDDRETLWQSAPISFTPIFSQLVPSQADQQFKADISVRGLVHAGIPMPLEIPYDLGIWTETPSIFVMDPHEILAEKILGWCVNRLVKHYADIAFISYVAEGRLGAAIPEWSWATARDTLDAKLEIMRKVYPLMYAPFPSVDPIIGVLAAPPRFDPTQWREVLYLKSERDRFTREFVTAGVNDILVPKLRAAARR